MFTENTMKALSWGTLSVALYYLLFQNERFILDLSIEPVWSVVMPIAVAFVFSIVHGNFTGYFWDALGVKARLPAKPAKPAPSAHDAGAAQRSEQPAPSPTASR
jgi:hypothetical protein